MREGGRVWRKKTSVSPITAIKSGTDTIYDGDSIARMGKKEFARRWPFPSDGRDDEVRLASMLEQHCSAPAM